MSLLYDKKYNALHFVGIGGISMSALAEICRHRGYAVSGSDTVCSETVARLIHTGIPVIIGHMPENVNGKDRIIYTAAVKSDNPELVAAQKNGIPIIERAPFLGELLQDYPTSIGIAGTHGKTTTTSMLSQIFLEADKDPTILVGGILPAIDSNYRIGHSEYAIFEACEYVDSFLNFYPKIAVITNIDEDHLDYFSGIDAIVQSFSKFLGNVPSDGAAVINLDDPNSIKAVAAYKGKQIRFSLSRPEAAYYAKLTRLKPYPAFEAYEDGKLLGTVQLHIPGKHNVYNALCAIAASRMCEIPFSSIADTLKRFSGAKRRFEFVGEKGGVTVVDDYAHHPTEIAATLSAAKTLEFKRLLCVFQPHTYTRTAALLDDFITALSVCDECLLLDIYAAREENTIGITSKAIADRLPCAVYCGDFASALLKLREGAKSGDLILTMGAGDVYKLGRQFLQEDSK